LKNVTAIHGRAEKLKEKFHFVKQSSYPNAGIPKMAERKI
jgi:hypothetical protein